MSFRSVAPLALAAALLSGSACGGNSAPSGLPSTLSAAGPLLGSITSAVPGLSQAPGGAWCRLAARLAKAKMPAAVKQGAPSAPSGLSSLTSFLGKSGISADQVKQIGGVLSQTIGSKVPADVASAFASALM